MNARRVAGAAAIATAVLLSSAGHFVASAAPAVPLDAVVAVRAVRGFQGLFEQPREASEPDPDAALGGPLVTTGVVVDVAALAAARGVPLPAQPAGAGFVLTTLRGVDGASSITVRAFERGAGTIPLVHELPAELVAADPTLNLALLRAGGLPPGVRIATAAPAAGSEVLRLAVTGGRVDARRVTIAGEGLTGTGDPLRLAALPALFLDQPIERDASGGALLDPATMALVGLAANAERTGIQGERRRAAGPQYAIPAAELAQFLAGWLDGKGTSHGALPWPGPELAPIDGRLAALLGLPSPGGYLVLEDWTADGTAALAEGDVLFSAAGRPLGAGGFPLAQLAHDAPPSRPLEVRGLRKGQPWTGAVPLVAARPERAGTVRAVEWAGAWFQDPADAFFTRGDERRGALVAYVSEGSAAEAAGLQALDLVQEVFGSGQFLTVTDARELERAVRKVREAPGFTGMVGLRVTDPTSPNLFAGIRVVLLGTPGSR
jgi:S1-C subfamily serine protease